MEAIHVIKWADKKKPARTYRKLNFSVSLSLVFVLRKYIKRSIGKLRKRIPLKQLLNGIEEESKRQKEDRDNDYD